MRDARYKIIEERENKKKKNKMIRRLFLICFFILLFGIIIFSLKKTQTKIQDNMNLKIIENNCIIHENQNGKDINVTYPKFDSLKLNSNLDNIINEIISKSTGNLEIKYNLYNVNDKYRSLQLIIKEKNKLKILDYNFDFETGEILKNDYFIKDEEKFTKIIDEKLSNIDDQIKSIKDKTNFGIFIKSNDIEIDFYNVDNIKNEKDYPKVYISFSDIKDIVIKDIIPDNMGEFITLKGQDIPKREVEVSKENIKNEKMIALTFDDGPHETYTNEILGTLRKYNCAATFFVLGNRAINNPDVLKNIVNSGSEIGNHSWSHPQLTKLSVSAMKKEINDTQNAVYNATKIYPKFVRPPYGAVNASVKSNIGKPMILWNVDTLDWKTKNTQMVLNEIMTNAKDGNIILLHDIHKTSKEAAILAIPKLVEQGFKLVTVSELFKAKGIVLESGKTYTNP